MIVTEQPGLLIASGRLADVFDLGDGTVLRICRDDYDCGPEARMMSWLLDQGVPVPRVHRAGGREMIMDKIDGITMLDDLERRPWLAVKHGVSLARLQRLVNAVEAPGWLLGSDGVPPGDAVLHLDFHPMNVMLGRHGPVVIDWTNVSRGPASFDGAMSVAIMGAFELSDRRQRIVRWVLVRSFLVARGRRAVVVCMAEACRYRLRDARLTPGERGSLQRLARQWTAPRS